MLIEAAEACRDAAASQELLLRMGREQIAAVDLTTHPELEGTVRVTSVAIKVSEKTIEAWNRLATAFEKLAQSDEG